MIEQQIEEIKNAVRELLQAAAQEGDNLSDEMQGTLAQALEHAFDRISILRQEQKQQEPAETLQPEAPISDPIKLLWILAGNEDSAFVNYLRTFPDVQFQNILKNPQLLTQTIERLQSEMPPGPQPVADGIQHGPLNSSNIYGFKYDPKNGRLLVRFNSGSVYGYGGVPAGVFKLFQQGAVPAKTSGQNKFGKWWTGKMPSAGAAFHELIRQGGYAYEKLK